MSPEFKEMLEEFLLEGEDDYISLSEVIFVVSETLHQSSEKLAFSDADKLWRNVKELITLMLENGFEVIDLAGEGKCRAWPEQNPEKVIQKIKELWVERKGDIEHSVWFNKVSK